MNVSTTTMLHPNEAQPLSLRRSLALAALLLMLAMPPMPGAVAVLQPVVVEYVLPSGQRRRRMPRRRILHGTN